MLKRSLILFSMTLIANFNFNAAGTEFGKGETTTDKLKKGAAVGLQNAREGFSAAEKAIQNLDVAKVEKATKEAKNKLLGTEPGENPDASERLYARYGKLQIKAAFLNSLKYDLDISRVVENISDELLGTGYLGAFKYAPGGAMAVTFGVGTLIATKSLVIHGVQPIGAGIIAIRNLLNRRVSVAEQVVSASWAPIKWFGGALFRVAVVTVGGAATTLSAYNVYSIYLSKPEFDKLQKEVADEIAATDNESRAIRTEIERRKNATNTITK